jgi:hypothetical protein
LFSFINQAFFNNQCTRTFLQILLFYTGHKIKIKIAIIVGLAFELLFSFRLQTQKSKIKTQLKLKLMRSLEVSLRRAHAQFEIVNEQKKKFHTCFEIREFVKHREDENEFENACVDNFFSA